MADDEDHLLFLKAVKGVTPLKKSQEKIEPHQTRPAFKFNKKKANKNLTNSPAEDIDWEIDYAHQEHWVDGNEPLFFAKDGISPRLLKKIKQNKSLISNWLDLHRLSAKEALIATDLFIKTSIKKNHRYIGIIHGKGFYGSHKKPVLKNILNIWLKEQPQVLAFLSANSRDGGTGALYILLRSASGSDSFPG